MEMGGLCCHRPIMMSSLFYAFLEAFLQGRDWASADLRWVSAVVDFPGGVGCGNAGGAAEEDGACV